MKRSNKRKNFAEVNGINILYNTKRNNNFPINWDLLKWRLYHEYYKKFFGFLVSHGNSFLAYKFLTKILHLIKLKEKMEPWKIIFMAMLKLTPKVIYMPVKKGSVVYKVPTLPNIRKQFLFAVKWSIKTLKNKNKSKHLNIEILVKLLIDTLYNKGEGLSQKMEIYNNAITNRYLLYYIK